MSHGLMVIFNRFDRMLPRHIIACILVYLFVFFILVFFLERRLNRNNCNLSKDRHAAYRGVNLSSSTFDCRANNFEIILADFGLKYSD